METPFNLLVLKAFHAQRSHVREAMSELGLSPGQPKVMQFLLMHGASLQKDLAAKCAIEPSTISRLLEALEQRGLIARRTPENDRRAEVVSLTEAGNRMAEYELWPRFAKINASSLAGFSADEQRKFRDFLTRMYANLTGGDTGNE